MSPRTIVVNLTFASYHLLGAELLVRGDVAPGAQRVFRDPAFLCLAFVLGEACSWAYLRSGGGLYAAVLTHAVPVTLWLELCGGERALRGGGCYRNSAKGDEVG